MNRGWQQMARALFGAAGLGAAIAVPGAGAQTMASGTVVELRGLDRVSGQTTDLSLAVGGRTSYARLEISVIGCRYPADNPNAEAYAYLDITDTQRGDRLFLGWMIASAPALNALDHARYDVWVLGCRQGTPTATADAAASSSQVTGQPGPAGATAGDAQADDPASTAPRAADASDISPDTSPGSPPEGGATPAPVTRSIVPPRRPVR